MAKAKRAKKKTLLEIRAERIQELEQELRDERALHAGHKKDVLRLEAEQGVIAMLLGVPDENEDSFSMFDRPTRKAKTEHEKIVQRLVRLKAAYAREDEGSAIEAEKSEQLMEVIGIILDDPTRKMRAHERIILAKAVAEGKVDPHHLDDRTYIQRDINLPGQNF